MKKKLLTLLLLLVSYIGLCQNTSYGITAEMNYYMIDIDGPLYANSGYSSSFGAFVDYKINNSFGVKGNLLYSKITEEDYYSADQYANGHLIFNKIELSALQADALLKLDVNKEYNKGFYLIGGFRFTNILDAESDTNKYAINDFYNNTNFGGLFGFGITFLKSFSIELMGNRNFTNPLNSNSNTAKNTGAQINLSFDIGSMINKS